MRLALGSAQFGLAYGVSNQNGQVSRDEVREIIAQARRASVDTIDTAIAYGDSEACLGEAGVTDFKIVTKLPPLPEGTDDVGQWVTTLMNGSLERLRVPHIHGLMLHRADQLLGPQGKALAAALKQVQREGMVAKVGISVYDPEQLAVITPFFSPDIVQAPLNLLDRRLETSGWLQRLHEAGAEVHARSAFLQGLLLMDPAAMPPRFGRWNKLWQTWHDWLALKAVSATRACLQYPLSLSQVDRVVVGVSSLTEWRMLLEDAATTNNGTTAFPDIACSDPDLINPSHWNQS